MATGEETSAHQKKKKRKEKKALWGFQTGRDKDWSIYTFEEVLSLRCESLLTLNRSIKNNVDDSIQDWFQIKY